MMQEPAANPLARRMVQAQIRARGIRDERVLDVMSRLPRESFVSGAVAADAYGDFPLSIGYGQTISQPYMVALMTQELALSGDERVLEVGTGSGYQTAILAELALEVYTIELVGPLLRRARRTLDRLGCANVHFKVGDGSRGWPEAAPFDRIIVAAAASSVPHALTEQLADNGIMVIPVGDSRSFQTLMILTRSGRHIESREGIGCRFVPLIQG
ncbi:MAG: protein-L-isoaspartate(D-aspartate) O-methyltransferase [Spirochaetales bacterium]|nr:protein-L-isoaspartate(D-aspartate) O-methyltransferase [Spirochaetales bacterium]